VAGTFGSCDAAVQVEGNDSAEEEEEQGRKEEQDAGSAEQCMMILWSFFLEGCLCLLRLE